LLLLLRREAAAVPVGYGGVVGEAAALPIVA
jgi:hypothetical protein